MGGSSGSGQTSTTTSNPLTKAQYDPSGYVAREKLLPELRAKYGVGLTPQETAYYRGTALGSVEKDAANTGKTLRENFSRMGIGPNDGAFAESLLNLFRDKMINRAGVSTDIVGKDIGMKQQNLANLLALISDSGVVGSAGSTTRTEGGSGSTGKNVLGGALGGGLAGASIPGMPWLGIPGAILGGLGGLL